VRIDAQRFGVLPAGIFVALLSQVVVRRVMVRDEVAAGDIQLERGTRTANT